MAREMTSLTLMVSLLIPTKHVNSFICCYILTLHRGESDRMLSITRNAMSSRLIQSSTGGLFIYLCILGDYHFEDFCAMAKELRYPISQKDNLCTHTILIAILDKQSNSFLLLPLI